VRNIKLVLEYDGTDFHGWQYQPNERTVQGELEQVLCQLTQDKIRIVGAGRTDQGVHAYGQVANFHTTSDMQLSRMKRAINAVVHDDIHIREIDEVPSDFHSRYSARAKTYAYYVLHEPSPMRRRYAWILTHSLDTDNMVRTTRALTGTHDFKHFSVTNGKNNTMCTIISINVHTRGPQTVITVTGDRFLHKMVRGIVGFLYDVGRERFLPHDADEVFAGALKDMYFAPAHGLFLMEVLYESRGSTV
jgi:tRNA pseudouridine38-40 synthase